MQWDQREISGVIFALCQAFFQISLSSCFCLTEKDKLLHFQIHGKNSKYLQNLEISKLAQKRIELSFQLLPE